MNILINALGIQDSGGITVLNKVLVECNKDEGKQYLIICGDHQNIRLLIAKYLNIHFFTFQIIPSKGFLHRLYFENIVFRKIIKKNKIDLVYNFSGSAQFFLTVAQLLKIQNLLFYSRKLDSTYLQNNKFTLWFKHIYLKRLVFKMMLKASRNIEIQSPHVKTYLSDFINTEEKQFYVKSDIDVSQEYFLVPKEYDLNKKINFLYIVGPHFEYVHKNFIDFTNTMLELQQEGLNFEISVTLTKEQLHNSTLWDKKLDTITNFLGYIDTKTEATYIFKDNTILISTSIIETLGLHVVEAIQNAILAIVPDEIYSTSVYGSEVLTYKLFDTNSMVNVIKDVILFDNNEIKDKILRNQQYLLNNENAKCQNIVEIFEKVVNVQK